MPKLQIEFDDDFLNQDITQEQLDAIIATIQQLIGSGAVTTAGVYDLEGNVMDIDLEDLDIKVSQNTTSRLH